MLTIATPIYHNINLMPLPIRLGLDNYAHARTVDTRPFFLGRVGPGNEASIYFTSKYAEQSVHN